MAVLVHIIERDGLKTNDFGEMTIGIEQFRDPRELRLDYMLSQLLPRR
jgi:hypothetical protein